jgi:3-methyl-2-oxobutanoate hydroxymethyltransferase
MSTYTIDTATSRANPTPAPMRRLTVPAIQARKGGEPIVMLTAYTARMAQLLDPHCDLLLVGDSLGQVIYGLPSTVPVTLEMMCAHGAAVVRGSYHSLVAIDLPFGSYEASPEKAFETAARVLKETGAAAVKLEGGEAMAETVAFLTRRGIPVIGHVGLTPQAVNALGGYRARGRDEAEAAKILADARAVAEAGCFALVLEGRDGRDRRRGHSRGRLPDDRDRRFRALRRAGAGHRGHARPVRTDASLREAVRRSGRTDRRRGGELCRRRALPRLPDRRPALSRPEVTAFRRSPGADRESPGRSGRRQSSVHLRSCLTGAKLFGGEAGLPRGALCKLEIFLGYQACGQ